ncbi:response regulator transcription factor [Oceanobacillus luteolus]|uniref:LuxR C-terminal-related transcriptional regulator n=1 Tax=Oceanobacillus luteolus TaxID=1274358 RepID=A0ABW4HQ33_9BACI|nr:response regulator transcription factor [Oceanobacillus luteolus]MCM3742033.1 response regulator transcription factor [Oceanobacillus luteolus]
MSVISFVMGAEVHKETVVEMVKEMLPDHELHVYNAAFIDDLFQAKTDSDLVILDLEAHISVREVVRNYRFADTKVAVILPDSEVNAIDDYTHFDLVGFFSVGMSVEELVDGIKYIQRGITYVHPIISNVIYDKYKQVSQGEVRRPIGLLTRREWEVLGELVKGCQNEEIAVNLDISDKTVKNHITSILGKLEVKDRTNAVLLALKERWFYL